MTRTPPPLGWLYYRSDDAIHTVHVARRPLRCAEDLCRAEIRPGDHYTLARYPPRPTTTGNRGWYGWRLCTDCLDIPDKDRREVVMRPDGRPYVRRGPLRCVVLDGDPDVTPAVLVLGTHDEARARELANVVAPFYVDPNPVGPYWSRLAMRDGEPVYVEDERRGVPSLYFEEAD